MLTNIEICEAIAHIEGWRTHTLGGYLRIDKDSYLKEYNPIYDDALCHQLIINHDLIRGYERSESQGFYYTDIDNILLTDHKPREYFFINEHGENKAALLAIIERHKSNQVNK